MSTEQQQFYSDLELGRLAEYSFTVSYSHYYLSNYNVRVTNVNYSDDNSKDILITTERTSSTFEIKHDLKASTTGNICIEVWNPKTKKPSGILASGAQFIVYLIDGFFYMIQSDYLKLYVAERNHEFKKVEKENSICYLIPITYLGSEINCVKIKNIVNI